MEQAALAICHREFNDTTEEIHRIFGFGQRDYAGKAKLEIGTKLLEDLIAADSAIVDFNLSNHSWRWLYHTSSIQALVENLPLNIMLGARYRRKATSGLPHAGIYSQLVVNIYSSGHLKLLLHPLVQQMKSYLTDYKPQFVVEK